MQTWHDEGLIMLHLKKEAEYSPPPPPHPHTHTHENP